MMTRHIKSVFVHPTMVDRVASMLNYFLLHLVRSVFTITLFFVTGFY